jgi:hypothetical protein
MARSKTFGEGRIVRGVVNSADASLGIAFTMYDHLGAVETLAATEYVRIESFQVVAAAAGRQSITNGGADTAANQLRAGTFLASSGMAGNQLALYSARGSVPKIFAPVGQVDANFEGRIVY